jgi:hypothetical protein
MRFEDERYVRLYTRDTTTWLMLGFEGQAVFSLLLRKVDRTGVFDLGGSDPFEAVAAVTRAPLEVVRTGLERLISKGVIEQGSDCLIFPKFLDAQEASMAPAARQKESRLRRRDLIRAGLNPNARSTVIYFIQSEHGGSIKIGRADDLAKRVVGLQTSRPDKLVVLAAVQGTVEQEKQLHARFAYCREKGEWFSPTTELVAFVNAVAVQNTLDVTVTIRDSSPNVTGHELYTVTPSRAVPNQPSLCPPSGDPVELEPEASEPKPRDTRPDEVWEHYVATLKRHRPRRRPTKLLAKDRKAIRAHLDAGLSVDDLRLACEGLFRSPHHLGQNDRNSEYLEIEYALRKPSTYIALAEDASPPPRSSGTVVRAELRESSPDDFVDPALVDAAIAELVRAKSV